MDKTTKWLLRTASLVIILSGIGGISIYSIKSGVFKNLSLSISRIRKDKNMLVNNGSCPKSHKINIGKYCFTDKGYESYNQNLRKEFLVNRKNISNFMRKKDKVIGGLELSEITSWCKKKASKKLINYEDCMNWNARGLYTAPPTRLERFVHKGKTYTASRACPPGQNMYWWVSGILRRKVSEMGCMTPGQFKTAKMEWEIKKLRQATRTNAINNAGNSINNLFQQQQINTNTWRLNN